MAAYPPALNAADVRDVCLVVVCCILDLPDNHFPQWRMAPPPANASPAQLVEMGSQRQAEVAFHFGQPGTWSLAQGSDLVWIRLFENARFHGRNMEERLLALFDEWEWHSRLENYGPWAWAIVEQG